MKNKIIELYQNFKTTNKNFCASRDIISKVKRKM